MTTPYGTKSIKDLTPTDGHARPCSARCISIRHITSSPLLPPPPQHLGLTDLERQVLQLTSRYILHTFTDRPLFWAYTHIPTATLIVFMSDEVIIEFLLQAYLEQVTTDGEGPLVFRPRLWEFVAVHVPAGLFLYNATGSRPFPMLSPAPGPPIPPLPQSTRQFLEHTAGGFRVIAGLNLPTFPSSGRLLIIVPDR